MKNLFVVVDISFGELIYTMNHKVNLSNIIQDTAKNPTAAITLSVFAAYGAWTLLTGILLPWLSYFKRHFLRRRYNFYQRYAKKDSWVVVTGGSDGVGLEICEQMAALGLNICIIARDLNKINEKLAKIAAKKSELKTRAIVFDLLQ